MIFWSNEIGGDLVGIFFGMNICVNIHHFPNLQVGGGWWWYLTFTIPETNIFAPENGWLEDEFPFGKAYFQGLR